MSKKKVIIIIIVVIVVCVLFLFPSIVLFRGFVDCVGYSALLKTTISTEKTVNDYLKEIYPDDEYTIELYKDVIIDNFKIHTWNVTSKKTGLEFYVQDYWECFTICSHELIDDYLDVYIYNKITELNDDRIGLNEIHKSFISEYKYIDQLGAIHLELNAFSSEEEMAKLALLVRNNLLSDEFILQRISNYFSFDIYRDGELISSVPLRLADSVDNILNILHSSSQY